MSRTRLLRAIGAFALISLIAACTGDTEPAQDITSTSARLMAWGRADSSAGDSYFEYGKTEAFGSRTPVVHHDGLEPGTTYDLGQDVSGLTPNNQYYFRACGKERADTSYQCGGTRRFTTSTFTNPVTYTAPVFQDTGGPVLRADPKIVREDGWYYLSSTGCTIERSQNLRTWQEYGSSDWPVADDNPFKTPLICGDGEGMHPRNMHLENDGNPLIHPAKWFGTEVSKVGNRWVLVTSGVQKNVLSGTPPHQHPSIWVAVADRPEGPYSWIDNATVRENSAVLIDPSVFVDPETNRVWLTWTQYPDPADGVTYSRLRAQELDLANLRALKAGSSPVDLLSTKIQPQDRERAHEDDGGRLIEGQGLTYKDGTYFLNYGAGNLEYDAQEREGRGLAVATYSFNVATASDFPMAAGQPNGFRKASNWVLDNGNGWRNPGHGAIFQDGGGTYWMTTSPLRTGEASCVAGRYPECLWRRHVFVQRMMYHHQTNEITAYDGRVQPGPIGVAE